MKTTIGFYKFEETALSLTMRLMDDFPKIEVIRKKNTGYNPGFPTSEYPFMLVLKKGAKLETVKKIHGDHFNKMKFDKKYKIKYDLSKSYYRNN